MICDNCVISCGTNVVEKIAIGNNDTIGLGVVVTNDVPDNAVVLRAMRL